MEHLKVLSLILNFLKDLQIRRSREKTGTGLPENGMLIV